MSKGQFITCDADGCTERLVPGVLLAIGKVRQAARKMGWRYVPGHPAAPQPAGRDFCPQHAGGAR